MSIRTILKFKIMIWVQKFYDFFGFGILQTSFVANLYMYKSLYSLNKWILSTFWIFFYITAWYVGLFFFVFHFKFVFLVVWLYAARSLKRIHGSFKYLYEPLLWFDDSFNTSGVEAIELLKLIRGPLYTPGFNKNFMYYDYVWWYQMFYAWPFAFYKVVWRNWLYFHILINFFTLLVPAVIIIISNLLNIIFQFFISIWIKKFIIISPFSIFLLILNSIFIFFFKKWLGPVGIFYTSISTLIMFIILNFYTLLYNLHYNLFIYVDLGRWIIINDLIDSHLLFCFDNLTVILSMVVALLTILAQFFGVEYMAREAFVTRLVYLLNLFATSVILLFCVFDFFLILISWECIGLFSFLLVNFYSTRIYTLKAALKTFIFSRISDMFIFISFNICILVFNTTDLTILFCKAPFYIFHSIYIHNISINILFLLTFTIALAGCIKGAQFFFHVWLPDAMEAPTPASALIHSSTLVIMGIYIIIRFNILFEFSLWTNYFLILIGGLTIAYGSVVACFQTDIKKLVAYSTISQMGYLICGCGFCAYNETIIYLIMHACNKAFLFIIVGYVVHFFNSNTDLRQMSHLYIYSFDISSLFLLISLNLIGLPYGSGFFSKEFLLFQILNDGLLNYFIRSMWFISFCFTPYYMYLLIFSLNFWNIKSIYKIISPRNFNKDKLYMFKRRWDNRQLRRHSILPEPFYFNELTTSPLWSLFTAFLFSSIFFIFNTVGEYFIYIIFNLTSANQFIINNLFLNLNINKTILITLIPNTTIEIIFYFVIIGVYLSLKFLIHFFNNHTKMYYKLIFIIDIYLLLFLILYLVFL